MEPTEFVVKQGIWWIYNEEWNPEKTAIAHNPEQNGAVERND